MEKKISFSFSKLTKKPSVFTKPPKEEKKIELVECFEGQTIKIKDAVEEVYTPLIIPIKDNAKNLLDRVRDAKAKQSSVLKNEVKEEVDERPDSELTIDELAARELIKEAKQRANNTETEKKVFVLPVKEEVVSLEGEKESTLEDYENIPVSDYGLAMLRGMGWKDGMGLGKNPSKTSLVAPPEVRPKGLGLGASRPIKPDILKQSTDKNGKELILIKGAFAKIIAGTHRGNYCEVQGLDDESGRVIVRTSLKGLVLTLNEFLVIPVTKEEYSMGSKVLNNAKYEEYKEKSDKNLEKARNGNGVQVIKVESGKIFFRRQRKS